MSNLADTRQDVHPGAGLSGGELRKLLICIGKILEHRRFARFLECFND